MHMYCMYCYMYCYVLIRHVLYILFLSLCFKNTFLFLSLSLSFSGRLLVSLLSDWVEVAIGSVHVLLANKIFNSYFIVIEQLLLQQEKQSKKVSISFYAVPILYLFLSSSFLLPVFMFLLSLLFNPVKAVSKDGGCG